MIRRARLVSVAVFTVALVALFLSMAPAPASGFPTRTVYDRTLAVPGTGPIAVGDLNGDGLSDVVAVDDGTGTYDVFIQSISGLPMSPSTAFQGPAARKILLQDIDGNGAKDIVALGTNLTRIYYQNAGSFTMTKDVATGAGRDIAAADLNGDGRADLAVLGQDVLQVWFQNRTTGAWPAFPSHNISAVGGHAIATADLAGDGLADLVLAQPYVMRVFPQTVGDLNLTGSAKSLDSFDGGTVALAVADMNGDAKPDVVLAETNVTAGYGEFSVYLGDGASFTQAAKVSGPLMGPFAVGDVNDDGVADIALSEHDSVSGTDSVAVFIQRFGGGFDSAPTFALSADTLGAPSGLAIGRLSGRPFFDVIARTRGALLVYEQEDVAPVMTRAVPSDFSFNAGSSGAGLIDLRNYFSDDHGILRFEVRYEENLDLLHATIAADAHHLDFTAAAGWVGAERFQVSATDGVPGHAPILSNVFSVMVNGVPRFTSAPPPEVRAGERLLYQVAVADSFPADDTHTFALLEAPAGMTIDSMTGLIDWTPTASDAGPHSVRVQVMDAHGGAAEQSFHIRVITTPAPPPTTAVVVATTLGALGVLGASALASENVKYGLLALFVPLYSKIKREQVLDHFVRGQIYGYVLANPGEHYNAIKVALNLTNGSLAHHLKTLEREHFIKSKRFGLYRRFYPMNMKIPEDGFFTPNEIQKTIVDLIRASPAITQKEIAERLGLTPPTVNYHVSILSGHRAIRVERAGRKTHCFVIEGEPTAGSPTPSGGPGTPGPSAPRPPA